MVGAGLVAVGCSAPGQPDRSSEPVTHLPAGVVTRAVAGVPCGATKARPREPLPATFKPVAVVRCYSKARCPSVHTPAGEACAAIGYLDPPFALVDRHGRILRPTLPATKCGRPFQAAITDLEHLPWVTVSVRRTVQIATRAELLAGCDPKYGDVIAAGSYFLQLRLSAGGPAFLPRPPRLRICIYQRGSETFIRGGIISQKGESELLADIQGGRSSTSCRWRHTSYAVLLAVSPAYRGGEIAEAEIGGCNRILRPDSQVGTISPAGLKVISRAFRSRQT